MFRTVMKSVFSPDTYRRWPLGRLEETEYDAFKKRISDYIIKALRRLKSILTG
jgi:hypothetical protein